MIIRIVKMTFDSDKVGQFLNTFHENKGRIRNFPGVGKLELLREESGGNVFFTYSTWTDKDALENYRRSELFKSVWKETRQLFSEKAEAWSVAQIVSL